MNMVTKIALPQATALLRKDCTINGRRLEHGLWLCSAGEELRFSISARIGEEESILEVGGSLSQATELFWRIHKGSVTPCSLADVVEDYWFDVENPRF